jgi:hypothetical protein
MDADEEFVRNNWEVVELLHEDDGVRCLLGHKDLDCDCLFTAYASLCGADKKEAIEEAAEFTHERLKQIADMEEEIRILNQVEFPKSFYYVNCPKDRILAREQVILAELRKGMKVGR